MFRPLCAHCGVLSVNRPRGLCWTCYYTPGVRELHPSTSKYVVNRGIGHGCGGYALPASPTSALPGSPEKVEVLAARVAAGVSLWHPDDASYIESAQPVRIAA